MSITPAAMLGRMGRLVLSMALYAGAASAATEVSTPEAGVERVRDAKVVAYREVLEDYDAAVKASPDDPALAVARCRFIGSCTDEDTWPVPEKGQQGQEEVILDLHGQAPEGRIEIIGLLKRTGGVQKRQMA